MRHLVRFLESTRWQPATIRHPHYHCRHPGTCIYIYIYIRIKAYYYWRKWNDPNLRQYCIKKGKKIIVDKRTGELAISPSFKDNVKPKQYKKGMEIFEELKIKYETADNEDVEEVVGMGALALEDSDEEEDDDDDDDEEEDEATEAMAAVRVE